MASFTDLNGVTLSKASSAMIAGTTSTYTTTVTTDCIVNGLFATGITAQTNTATPTTDATTGAAFNALGVNKTCAIVLGQTVGGVIKMAQGPIIDTYPGVTTTVGAFKEAPQFPALPSDFCPLAYTLVRTAPDAASWTPGTSSWTASGVSATTFKNVAVLPQRPKIA